MMKISVVIPVFNGEKFIGRCLDSVLNQQGDFESEILVIDDGSADNTAQVVKQYEKAVLVSMPNRGVASARNTGLLYATGDLVLFVDADDALKPGALSLLLKKQQESNADIVRFRYEIIRDNNSSYIPHKWQVDFCEFVEKDDFTKKIYPLFFKGICLNSVCMAMFKRETISGIRFRTDMKTAEDAVFSLMAYSSAESALFIDDALYCYYQHSEGLTGSGLSLYQKYKDNFVFSIELIKHLKDWKMNSPKNWLLALSRPIRLTWDKMKRRKLNREA